MNTPDRAELTAAVKRISTELKQAQKDLVLLQRLKDAEANAKRLSAELEATQAALIEAAAAEVAAKRAANHAAFEDITINRSGDDNLLAASFEIIVVRRSYDDGRKVLSTLVYSGFNGLPADVYAYLIEVHPERIPAAITALSPDDPWQAFHRFFVSKRRGYVALAAA